MKLDEALDMGKEIILLASELPQVPLELNGDQYAESEIDKLLDKLNKLYEKWNTGDNYDACPDCGAQIIRNIETKYYFLKKTSFYCGSCDFIESDENEYNRRKINKLAETKGISAAKYVALAGKLISSIGGFIENGELSLLCGESESLILKDGEKVELIIPAILLTERSIRHSKTQQTSNPNRSYIGGSFRVAKGAYIHLGGSMGQQRQSETVSTSVDELFPKDWGSMVVTNYRLSFIGENIAATSFELSKLISLSLTEMEEGRYSLMFQISNRQRPIILTLQDIAFQPSGVPWPLIHPQLGIKANQISARIKSLASAV